ncbi:hypothetical protein NQ314_021020 [Rhamnusium bicolor]|uniref:Uncharacterized protein n=1 Tax=Rhamnusium bicolor TaxID=1586634 RepID=A0AAV8WJ32_9CUCU|nr:hypothetical protein NQ314_021020 [Rhamnusium bicolor]
MIGKMNNESTENPEDQYLLETDRLNACTDISDYDEESDKDEEDEEFMSEHDTDSEGEWVPSDCELDNEDKDEEFE